MLKIKFALFYPAFDRRSVGSAVAHLPSRVPRDRVIELNPSKDCRRLFVDPSAGGRPKDRRSKVLKTVLFLSPK